MSTSRVLVLHGMSWFCGTQGNVMGAPRTPPIVQVYELDDILGGSLFIDEKSAWATPKVARDAHNIINAHCLIMLCWPTIQVFIISRPRGSRVCGCY
jgi:hypothetical protein